MKLTIDGMPLHHLTLPHQLEAIWNYGHSYLLVNETLSRVSSLGSTPSINSIFINPTILNDFSFMNTRAIPLKKSFRNKENGIIVGRSESCDIIINGRGVSRKHLRILSDGDLAFVENLSKTNGMVINDVKKDVAKLESQTIICLGGLVGAAFISADDLQMLCSMLPGHWNKLNTETRTSIELPRIAPLA